MADADHRMAGPVEAYLAPLRLMVQNATERAEKARIAETEATRAAEHAREEKESAERALAQAENFLERAEALYVTVQGESPEVVEQLANTIGAPSAKPGRGRGKKAAVAVIAEKKPGYGKRVAALPADAPVPVKRGPGRPPKNPLAPGEAPVAKRRGRPPKNLAPAGEVAAAAPTQRRKPGPKPKSPDAKKRPSKPPASAAGDDDEGEAGRQRPRVPLPDNATPADKVQWALMPNLHLTPEEIVEVLVKAEVMPKSNNPTKWVIDILRGASRALYADGEKLTDANGNIREVKLFHAAKKSKYRIATDADVRAELAAEEEQSQGEVVCEGDSDAYAADSAEEAEVAEEELPLAGGGTKVLLLNRPKHEIAAPAHRESRVPPSKSSSSSRFTMAHPVDSHEID